MEEFYAVYGDDDKEFVGKLSPSGFFTPSSEGPNPKRKFSRNNYGDVWVVATYKGRMDKDGKPLTGKILPGGGHSSVCTVGSAGGSASDFPARANSMRSKAAGGDFYIPGAERRDFRARRHHRPRFWHDCRKVTLRKQELAAIADWRRSASCTRRASSRARRFRRPAAAAPRRFSAADDGDESHQSVQPVLPVLLRIRRRQSRHARRQAEVHGFRDGQASVDYLFKQSAGRRGIHITFFGGETLMNFPLLKQVVDYAKRRPRTGPFHRFQPDHQRHAADAGDHRISFDQRHRRDGEHGRRQGIARQIPRLRERPRQL